MPLPHRSYQEFTRLLEEAAKDHPDVVIDTYATVTYEKGSEKVTYDLLRIVSRDIGREDPILLLRACIHGNEPAGALTIMKNLPDIVSYAHAHGVKLVIYPLDNPSGYERELRYNMEDDSGDCGNNDFVRYTLNDGTVVDDLGDADAFQAWGWSSDPQFSVHLPKETIALHQELKKIPLMQVRAVIDFHQDNYIVHPGAYWYAFPDTARYKEIVEKIEKETHVFKNEHIDSGFLNGPSYVAEKAGPDGASVPDEFDPVTDERGFIRRHDGTLPDLLFRLGTEHCITVETTTVSDEAVIDRINLLWIYGLIDLLTSNA